MCTSFAYNQNSAFCKHTMSEQVEIQATGAWEVLGIVAVGGSTLEFELRRRRVSVWLAQEFSC